VLPGDVEKVYHGRGPIIINFKEMPYLVSLKLF
jgi:hypothetical protein